MKVNYRKIDAPLAAALEESADKERAGLIEVFVHIDKELSSAEKAYLKEKGITASFSALNRRNLSHVFTAPLSPDAIADLSNKPWINYLRLSRKLRLLGGEEK